MEIIDTSTLLPLQQRIPVDPLYWLDSHFPNLAVFQTSKVMFDKIKRGKRLAPFVLPTVEGVVMKDQGYQTTEFQPAYVKPKHAIRPSEMIIRRAGEALGGSSTPGSRYNLAVALNLKIEKGMIFRTEEKMASELMLKGSITVKGDNYPEQIVDFGRNAAHTVTLVPGTQWGETGVSIKKSINEWTTMVHTNSGEAPTRITVSPDVYDVMLADPEIEKMLDINKRGTTANLSDEVGSRAGAQYKGNLSTNLEVWTLSESFEDNDGNSVELMPPGTVVLSSPSGFEGYRCYGAIEDMSALNRGPIDLFPKILPGANLDPSVDHTMTQSAPLPASLNIDSSLAATVY